ncbi:MAG: flagellin [Beijerinckiaceae bacterium]
MAMNMSLTVGMRNALYSLTDLQGTIEKTNNRLATGKKVNSALDNALNYFTAAGLSNRATQLSIIQDNIGLGIKIHQNADKALSSMKSMLENAEGQLRGALQSTGQNNKATSNYAFTGVSDTFLSAAAGPQNRLGTGDTFSIQLTTTNTSTGAISNVGAAVAITLTGTVQNVMDSINTNVTLNPAGQASRIKASLNDLNQLVIESSGGEDPTAVIGFQINADLSAGTQSLISDAFSYTGAGNAPMVSSGTAATAQTLVARVDINQTRKAVAAGFRELLTQIGNTAADAGYNGTNLLNGDSLRVGFNEDDTTSILTKGVRFNAVGIGFRMDDAATVTGNARYGFQSDFEIKQAQALVKAAKSLIEAQSRTFANNFNILQNRQDFTTSVKKNLNEGSDLLTIADMNEEGANLASLQTRQQLSVTALSLANQSDQAILRLF